MKHAPLMFVSLVPFMATALHAEPQTEYESLRHDVPVTEIIGNEVKDKDGKEIGEVEDVIVGEDGEVKTVLVEYEPEEREDFDQVEGKEGREYASIWGDENDRMQRLTTTDSPRQEIDKMPRAGVEPRENLEQTAGYNASDRAGGSENAGEVTEIEWQSVSMKAGDDVLQVDGSVDDYKRVRYEDDDALVAENEIRASKLVGMEVNLADDNSFGEVEDVLISRDGGQVTAFVVDSMDYFEKETYALPAHIDSVDAERDEVNYQYTTEQVESLEEFDLEDDSLLDD